MQPYSMVSVRHKLPKKRKIKLVKSDDVAPPPSKKATPCTTLCPAQDCRQGGGTVVKVRALKNNEREPFLVQKTTFSRQCPLEVSTLLRVGCTLS